MRLPCSIMYVVCRNSYALQCKCIAMSNAIALKYVMHLPCANELKILFLLYPTILLFSFLILPPSLLLLLPSLSTSSVCSTFIFCLNLEHVLVSVLYVQCYHTLIGGRFEPGSTGLWAYSLSTRLLGTSHQPHVRCYTYLIYIYIYIV